MERLLAKISIRKKLTIVIMLASLLILMLVAGVFVAVEIYSSRNHLLVETKTLADSLAANLKQPLLINDLAAANRLLSSLHLKQGIRAAYLFDAGGDPVAYYLDQFEAKFLLAMIPQDFSAPNRALWTTAEGEQILSSWSHLSLFTPLFQQGQRVGTLYLLTDLKDLYSRVSGVVFGALLALLLLLGVSWYLAGKLQRPVSTPLMNLVGTMALVSRQKDYRIRAEKQTEDEIGELVDGFNRILSQVEQHRNQLEKHQETLEQTVALRTSELREMIIALRQTKQQLEDAGKAKSQFIASITHELRTPLVGVLGMNELLFRTPLNEEQQTLAEMVQKSGADLLLLINNILDFSRIEAGKLRLEPVEFAIHLAIESVLEMLAGQAEEKGLLLVSEIPLAAVWRVRGDEVRLKQILLNLVGNAIKFTEQGEVRVSLSLLSANASQGQFEIRVSDTGVGMDELTQQQVFSAFFQADSTSTRNFGGSGLGLSIVSQLVDLMAGEISLESRPGAGSCFRVALDLQLETRVDFALPEEVLRQQVLFCTVDCPWHEMLAMGLRALGLTIQRVSTVAETWSLLRKGLGAEPPLVLLLCTPTACLPGGEPLYQAVRDDQRFQTLRRILLLSRFSTLSLVPQETRLGPPLGWQGLWQALRNSRPELQLVQKTLDQSMRQATSNPALEKSKPLLVAGGGVASRELVKLALLETSLEVESAPDLTDLLSGSAPDYAAVLLDLPFLPEQQVRSFFAQPDNILKSLLFYDHEAQLLPYAAEVKISLKKPFDRQRLQEALDSLLALESVAPWSRREGQE
jgi:signal transduction histidine kinase